MKKKKSYPYYLYENFNFLIIPDLLSKSCKTQFVSTFNSTIKNYISILITQLQTVRAWFTI